MSYVEAVQKYLRARKRLKEMVALDARDAEIGYCVEQYRAAQDAVKAAFLDAASAK